MHDDQLNDLKQFIAVTVPHATTGMAPKDGVSAGLINLQMELDQLHIEMNQRFDEVQSSIPDIIAANNDTIDEQLTDHEHRLTKLEHQSI